MPLISFVKVLLKHTNWEVVILLIKETLASSENCFQILQYISDKIDHVMHFLVKEVEKNSLLTEKLELFLRLYSCVCKNIKMSRMTNDSYAKSVSSKLEDSDVTMLWQQKLGVNSSYDENENWFIEVDECQVLVLEKFVIQMKDKSVFLSLLAIETLNIVKQLSRLK